MKKGGERSSRIYIIHYHPGKIGALCFGNPYNDMMGCGKPNSGHQHFISHWRLICYIHGLYFDINQQCGMLCSKMKDASICGSLNAESGDATMGFRVPKFSNKPISLFFVAPTAFLKFNHVLKVQSRSLLVESPCSLVTPTLWL